MPRIIIVGRSTTGKVGEIVMVSQEVAEREVKAERAYLIGAQIRPSLIKAGGSFGPPETK
jgi:hypothetical protein